MSFLVIFSLVYVAGLIYFALKWEENWNNDISLPKYSLLDAMKCWGIKRKHSILGQKLNKKICKENLEIFDDIMKKYNIKYFLVDGTALGLIRDGDLIDYDDDVDLMVHGEYKNIFVEYAWPELLQRGFRSGGTDKYGTLLCGFRKGEKVDIDFLIDDNMTGTGDMLCKDLKKYLLEFGTVNYGGRDYTIPVNEEYYVKIFGDDWRIPKRK